MLKLQLNADQKKEKYIIIITILECIFGSTVMNFALPVLKSLL